MECVYLHCIGAADACQRELAALPDDAARICFLKRHRRRLMESLHNMQEKVSCIDYMIDELEQRQKECGRYESQGILEVDRHGGHDHFPERVWSVGIAQDHRRPLLLAHGQAARQEVHPDGDGLQQCRLDDVGLG